MERDQPGRQTRVELVQERVHQFYWDHDWNCAMTSLCILAEVFDVALEQQVLHAALGMHGAGGYRAQCGLVEGALIFVGILGKARGLTDEVIVEICHDFAEAFENRFGSLLCLELRPEGFEPDNPPHLCEDLTRKAVLFDIGFIIEKLGIEQENDAGQTEPVDLPATTGADTTLSHLDDEGGIRMVGVGHKPATERVAVAKGEVRMRPETLRLIAGGDALQEPALSSPKEPTRNLPKGDVLTTAQIAGIMAAKRTHDLIPLCHPLSLTKVDVEFAIDEPASRIEITATARCTGQTGVEMEALTAVSLAALTIYDMAKAVEKAMQIGQIHLVSKTGGESGDWRLEDEGDSL